jgi:hypothetical protein
MFHIHFDDELIGLSALEAGDPPMGCAEGVFIPHEGFKAFQANVPAENDNDPAIKRWLGLTVTTDGTVQIDCADVVLLEVNFGDEIELRVDALGIGYPLYEELFPGRYAAYEASLS